MSHARRHARPQQRVGFSVLEILVALVVVAILLAITIPTLRSVRDASRRAESSSNLRTHAQILTVYTLDHAGTLPGWRTPSEFEADSIEPPFPQSRYFRIHTYWHLIPGRDYYEGGMENETLWPDGFRRSPESTFPYQTPYLLPCTFAADPGFWDEETRRYGDGQWGAQRLSRVAYPSKKALVVESWPHRERVRQARDRFSVGLPVALADGSTQRPSPRERYSGYPKGDGASHQALGAVHPRSTGLLLHTREGVLGRDIR